jgi:hypothetical protein
MYQFLSGAIMFGSFVVAVFFARSWKRSGDRFFLMFAIAFALMGIERLLLGALNLPEEPTPRIYLIRFAAFLLIVAAIIDKNRAPLRR